MFGKDNFVMVGEVEMAFEAYEFHLFGVFYDEAQRKYFTGTDSGCSCPSPWEDNFNPATDLKGPFNFSEALRELDRLTMEGSPSGRLVDAAMDLRSRFIAFAKANGTFPVQDKSYYADYDED